MATMHLPINRIAYIHYNKGTLEFSAFRKRPDGPGYCVVSANETDMNIEIEVAVALSTTPPEPYAAPRYDHGFSNPHTAPTIRIVSEHDCVTFASMISKTGHRDESSSATIRTVFELRLARAQSPDAIGAAVKQCIRAFTNYMMLLSIRGQHIA